MSQELNHGPPAYDGRGHGLDTGTALGQPGLILADEPPQLLVPADLACPGVVDHHLSGPHGLQSLGVTAVQGVEVLRDRISLTCGTSLLSRQLDGRSVKTPASKAFAVPSRGIAEAIAAEWRAQVEIIDPTDESVCETYTRFRRSLSTRPDGTGEPWTLDRTRKEAFATILAACWYHQRYTFLRIEVALSQVMSTFRWDVSSHWVIMTQEDPAAPAMLSLAAIDASILLLFCASICSKSCPATS